MAKRGACQTSGSSIRCDRRRSTRVARPPLGQERSVVVGQRAARCLLELGTVAQTGVGIGGLAHQHRGSHAKGPAPDGSDPKRQPSRQQSGTRSGVSSMMPLTSTIRPKGLCPANSNSVVIVRLPLRAMIRLGRWAATVNDVGRAFPSPVSVRPSAVGSRLTALCDVVSVAVEHGPTQQA